ncbi:MAG: FHA domain-containing protein [Solirubrobacteraceae bacterium]|jgi:pSer/pThr/pTyr-binding forkhead associated (FHA) protein
MGAARLEVVAGNAAGSSIVVEDELLVGRHAQGAGRLADDDEISRSHARVTVDASGFCAIEDLGSTNGTFVNGLRISAPQTLSEGDTIEIGATTLVVRELPPLPSAPTPAKQPTIGPVPAAPAGQATPVAEQAAPAIGAPTLSLRLQIDFAAREAQLLIEGIEPLRLVYDAGAWRREPSPPD